MSHKTYYTQQYSKCLGNNRPTIIVEIEKEIWKQLFAIARGYQTVHQAADKIIEAFPASFDNVDPEIRKWFIVGMDDQSWSYYSLVIHWICLEQPEQGRSIHLSSFVLEDGSLYRDWPLSTILAPDNTEDLMEIDSSVQNLQVSNTVIEMQQDVDGILYSISLLNSCLIKRLRSCKITRG